MRQSVLFYKDILYKSILAILICIAFVWPAGCMEYSNPHLEAVKAEGQVLAHSRTAITEEYATYTQNIKYWQQCQIEFMRKLTVEELAAYERLCSTPIDNVPQMALNQRLFLGMLSEENTTAYWGLVQIGAGVAKQKILLDQKVKAYNERVAKHNQNVQLGIELIKLQMQQSQWYYLQSQQYWQNYYNQQYK